ncbi:putative taxadien-5-alpha-ol O-acetyltransferase [Medicago truncatula]|uniref:Putative taxadien-5-alpha-ol O-acetyltransferase n=1 Tax=Medicago truncatula TaxID=3880 RepID=A0A396JPB2_MEDTR|nr:putative taxadien-5-alpha-ol O-acetyltransferase [Medicago truncatula]
MKLPQGYYGNAFVLASAYNTVKDLVAANNLDHCVKLVQQAKASDKTIVPDGSLCLPVTQWNRLGLEEVDFGEGKPLYTSPTANQFHCLFLPVIGDPNAIRVVFSVPMHIVEKFQRNMTEIDSNEASSSHTHNHLTILRMVMLLLCEVSLC